MKYFACVQCGADTCEKCSHYGKRPSLVVLIQYESDACGNWLDEDLR